MAEEQGEPDADLEASLSAEQAFWLIGGTAAAFVLGGVLAGLELVPAFSGTLFLVGGPLLVIALALSAALGRSLDDGIRTALGIAAGLVAILYAGLLAAGLAYPTPVVCGASIALPSMGAFFGLIGAKGLLVDPPPAAPA